MRQKKKMVRFIDVELELDDSMVLILNNCVFGAHGGASCS